jgi:hypothetical protein
MIVFDDEFMRREAEERKKAMEKEVEERVHRYLRVAAEAILKNPSLAALSEQSRVSLVAAFMVSAALAEVGLSVGS